MSCGRQLVGAHPSVFSVLLLVSRQLLHFSLPQRISVRQNHCADPGSTGLHCTEAYGGPGEQACSP